MGAIESLIDGYFSGSWGNLLLAVVDISLVYYIVYRILLLIKGTKAVQMLVGLLVIIVFFFLSKEDYLNLPSLNFILDKFIASFILIVIVVFQDDIRRGLSEFGKTSVFLKGRSVKMESHVIEEVVKGSVMLASNKLGALIAVEREADLSSYVTEGFELNARVSKELLFSTFNPSHANPLHDGAVIIRGDRLVSAGCFLPLTNNATVAKTLGTRHRAAIGLSEETDAAIVIVSEETGTISIAYRGDLIRGLDATKARDALHRIFSYGQQAEADKGISSLRQWIRVAAASQGRRHRGHNHEGSEP